MKRIQVLTAPLLALAISSCASNRTDPYDTGNMYGYPDAANAADPMPPADGSLYEAAAVYEESDAPDLTPADPSASGSYYRTHTVSAGETLSRISSKYNVKMSAIIQANNIKNKNLLSIGQKLIIPSR